MRVEPLGIGSIAHVIKRGARGIDVVRDESDRRRFVNALFYLNDTHLDENWTNAIQFTSPFTRPSHWPESDPLVHILAWTLMPNHFHLLLREIREGGIAKFMQRLCGSMSAASNAKYRESGSLFQGAYRSRTINEDVHLRYLAFYIQVKNVLELRPGGLKKALVEFDDAWKWATEYPYSSFSAYTLKQYSPLICDSLLTDLFPDQTAFKKEAYEMLRHHVEWHTEGYGSVMLETW